MENDEYDDGAAYYILTFDNAGISGCVRLRPSTSPTLMTGPFRSLKDTMIHDKDHDQLTWEASRFFVTPRRVGHEREWRFDKRSYALFLSMIEFGMMTGFANYEVVVDPAMARFLRVSGWALKVVNSGLGTLNDKVYYGFLPCNEMAFRKVMASAEKKSQSLYFNYL